LLGVGFADPDHLAALGAVFIENELDHLAAPNIETSAQPETFFEESTARQGSLFDSRPD